MGQQFQSDFQEIEKCDLPWDKLKGKTILCTGGNGFLMGYFIKYLQYIDQKEQLGLKIYLFQRENSNKQKIPGHQIFVIYGEITRHFIPPELHPDIIIHAASPANNLNIAADPEGVVETNVMATHYLLEQARNNHSIFLYFSSGAVYNHMEIPISEEMYDPFLSIKQPDTLYGKCKAIGELLCCTYRRKYTVDCRIVRPFSVFGPGEKLDSGRCFTEFISQTLKGETIELLSSGRQIRSYCYQSDFTSGLLYILLKGNSTVYNHGNEDNSCTIAELAEHFSHMGTNLNVKIPHYQKLESSKLDMYVPNTQKLRSLGWRPKVNLDDCIKRSLAFYSKNSI